MIPLRNAVIFSALLVLFTKEPKALSKYSDLRRCLSEMLWFPKRFCFFSTQEPKALSKTQHFWQNEPTKTKKKHKKKHNSEGNPWMWRTSQWDPQAACREEACRDTERWEGTHWPVRHIHGFPSALCLFFCCFFLVRFVKNAAFYSALLVLLWNKNNIA